MCGIAGFIGSRRVPDERVVAALETMGRRGPDGRDHRRFSAPDGRQVVLLHSRLRIIDLDERANQPFSRADWTIAFNGELYNFVELRREMEGRGATFRTSSDTEVLLAALEERGTAVLDACEGMWAFAAWDAKTSTLHLSRDRFGEKPLFLMREGDGFYFASEIKTLAALAGRRPAVDLEHVRRYLVNGYKALYKKPRTFFRDVSELPSGTVLSAGPTGIVERRYWDAIPAVEPDMSLEEAVRGTRERLIRSVELRLRADVPLAFCMSGGVDSNALISIAKRTLGYDVHGFTIVSKDERYAEADLVEHAVSELSLRHTAVETDTRDFLPRLRTLVRQHDAPIYTITYYAHWLLMESVKKAGYRISVSGTAADELFSGYFDHHLAYFQAVKDDESLHARAVTAWREHVQPIVRNPYLSNADLFVDDPTFRGHVYLDADLFSRSLVTPFDEPFDETAYVPELLRNRMLNELFAEAVPVILHEDDSNAMYHGVENRSPFLDRDLFEWSCRIPTKHLVRDGAAKAVLRDSMRGIVPDRVLDSRRKVGFNAPVFDFLDRNDPAVRAELMADSPIWDVVRRDAVTSLLDAESLPNSKSKFLFNFVCAKLFLEELGLSLDS